MMLEATKADEEHRTEGGIFTMLKKVKRTAASKPPYYKQIEVRHNVFALRSVSYTHCTLPTNRKV